MNSRHLAFFSAALSAIAILLLQPAEAAEATAVEAMKIKLGFKVERLYSVPKEREGSWVAMTIDTKGRLICSDQYGGLYRLTPGATAGDTKVEVIDVKLGQAQGMVYAFDSLYLIQANDAYDGRGLYRVRDTVSINPSIVSMMPPGLLNMMRKDDVLDLLAYLISGGNCESDLFK